MARVFASGFGLHHARIDSFHALCPDPRPMVKTGAKPSKILVIGAGGREHALGARLLACPSVTEVVVAPGNAGTTGNPVPGKTLRSAVGDPLEVAAREAPDLVVIGPEVPLCNGVSDRLTAAGYLVFGPTERAAQLEGSKAFMKQFAARHGLPTARFHVVADVASAERAIADFAGPPVIKADGLCAGKGVVVADSHAEALSAARRMLSGEAFGAPGQTVVIEERTAGEEASMHAICDGERFMILPAAQDHKRIFDGDRGPNTGGMGAYAPAPVVTPELHARIRREIFERTLQGMAADGHPFRGTLYAGLMITPTGDISLIEFNVRFGDPETQVLMAVLEGDLATALSDAARGELRPELLQVSSDHALCMVLAAGGYPEAPRTGDVIRGLPAAQAVPGVQVFHSGTTRKGDDLVTAGGRVLGVTARAPTLTLARERAYQAAALIEFDGCQYRQDIAARALGPKATTLDLDRALAQLEAGKVVAAATESFFGLLADIGNPLAVEALFRLKPRGEEQGVPTLLPTAGAWAALVEGGIPELARAFAAAFWPGPLSIALPAAGGVSPRVAQGGTLAVRLPGASPASELATRFGRPLSATSANLPGAPATTQSSAVEAVFDGAVERGELLVVPGSSRGGAPSTVVVVTGKTYRVARVAAVSLSALDAIAMEHGRGA